MFGPGRHRFLVNLGQQHLGGRDPPDDLLRRERVPARVGGLVETVPVREATGEEGSAGWDGEQRVAVV